MSPFLVNCPSQRIIPYGFLAPSPRAFFFSLKGSPCLQLSAVQRPLHCKLSSPLWVHTGKGLAKTIRLSCNSHWCSLPVLKGPPTSLRRVLLGCWWDCSGASPLTLLEALLLISIVPQGTAWLFPRSSQNEFTTTRQAVSSYHTLLWWLGISSLPRSHFQSLVLSRRLGIFKGKNFWL